MIHLKLDATDSTNSFLRDLAREGSPENWTVVSTGRQTNGRGQKGAGWFSDEFKNLTFSILIKGFNLRAQDQFVISCAVSVALHRVLERCGLNRLSVKWPNDIMSGSSKIAGILIENFVMSECISQSIVGIGLNVNQERFPAELSGATSMFQLTGRTFDLDMLLEDVVSSIQEEMGSIQKGDAERLWTDYEKELYRRDRPSMFRKPGGEPFLGQILGVSEKGMLKIRNEDGTVAQYGHKEIEYL